MKKIKSNWAKALYVIISITIPIESYAQLFPLSENDWNNPEFVERYLGSYGVDMELSPEITLELSMVTFIFCAFLFIVPAPRSRPSLR